MNNFRVIFNQFAPLYFIAFILLSLMFFSSPLQAEDDAAGERLKKLQEVQLGHYLTPAAFRDAASKAQETLVTIETYGGIIKSSSALKQPGQRKKQQVAGISKPGEGPTTGVLISKDGYILTSTYNFFKKPSHIIVTLPDDSQYVAELLGRDETRKLCVLKIKTNRELKPAEFVDPGKLRVGQWAISVGVGYGGDEPAISSGIISATNRVFGKAIQTDANISPANYGGPLIDIDGNLIGICVPLSPRQPGVAAGVEWYDSGIGFAIPVAEIKDIVERMKKGEVIVPGIMGIRTSPDGKGAIKVIQVVPKSAAAEAGLKKDDKILQINGQEIKDMMQLRQVAGRFHSGDNIAVLVETDGKKRLVQMTLKSAEEMKEAGNNSGPGNNNKPDQPNDNAIPAEGDKDKEPDAQPKPEPEKEDVPGEVGD